MNKKKKGDRGWDEMGSGRDRGRQAGELRIYSAQGSKCMQSSGEVDVVASEVD